MNLNDLRDNPGARKERTRVGRGIGSGKGKTCGSGVKGQKARTGVAINGFEGGQNPLYRRLPKRGFNNFNFTRHIASINLGQLQTAVDSGKIDPKKPVNYDLLIEKGLVRSNKEGVKILGHGELTTPLDLHVLMASKSAIAAVEKIKGKITLLEAKTIKE